MTKRRSEGSTADYSRTALASNCVECLRGVPFELGADVRRIIAQTKITNLSDESKFIQCGMFVDTGAGALILPAAWKERLGDFLYSEPVELQLANGDVVRGETCWPVKIEIEGFRPVSNEVVFMGGEDEDDFQEPLLGYVILGQAQAAVDMLGHRLVPVRYIDLK